MSKEFENFETAAIRIQSPRGLREHAAPIYMTSSFVFNDAEHARALFANEIDDNIYSRFSNPNNEELTQKLCVMEGTEDGVTTATGMSALFTTIAGLLGAGDHVIASSALFGSTHQLLEGVFPRWNISHTYAPMDDTDSWESLIKPETKMLLVETPSNPGLDILDLEKLGQLAKARGLIYVVDNCFATPYLQQPAKWGADLVTHSATKFMDGQGRCLGGAVLGSKKYIEPIRFFARHSGPALSPFNGWVLSKSLETLAVRMDRHCQSALELANRLKLHPQVERVAYPFLPEHPGYEVAKKQMRAGGGIVSFTVKGGLEKGRKFLDSLQMCSHSANLGDTRTICTHPASTTHSKRSLEQLQAIGIDAGTIRVSVGLENIDDIYADLDAALNSD